MIKKIIIFNIMLFSFLGIYGQQQEVSGKDTLNIGMDLMSRYIFRGTDVGRASPSIQPHLEYVLDKMTLGLWGAYATNQTGSQEADIYITYNFTNQISLTLTDYYFPFDNDFYQYFDYQEDSTGHLLEMSIHYAGTKKLPLSFLIATNFYGADALRLNQNGTKKDIQYSTYTELAYTFKKNEVFVGFNLTNPDETLGETGFYGNAFGVVNLGISTHKMIKISPTFDLPFSLSFITNPQAQKVFLVAGISL